MNDGLFIQGYMTLKGEEALPGAKDMRDFIPAIIRDIAPRDGVERMLATQMAATHVALVRQGGRERLPQFEAHERAHNKLARTFAAQMEALRKHRNGGKQVVQVQHVKVADGGQAIVGNVEAGGGARMKVDANRMSKAHAAPRCTAHSKRTGKPCTQPAVTGWKVCRFHGARGGHKAGPPHPQWKHGMRSRQWTKARKNINDLVRATRENDKQTE